jgi:glycosyltransferase involved in cell wall biosynthesis
MDKETTNNVGILFPAWKEELGGPFSILSAMLEGRVFGEAKVTLVLVGQAKPISKQNFEYFSKIGVDVIHVPAKRENLFGLISLKKIYKLVQELSKFDTIILNYVYSLNFTYAVISKAINKTQNIVLIPHGSFTNYQESHKKMQKQLFKWMIIYPFYKKINRVITFHATELKMVPQIIASKAEVAKVPLYQVNLPSQGDLKGSRMNFVFVGRIHPTKRIDLIIEAVKILKDRGTRIIVDILGEGDNSEKVKLINLVEFFGIENQINFLGWVSGNRKNEILMSKAALILPSDNESFGLVIPEAINLGMYCIVSNGVALSNDLEIAGFGMVFEKGNAESLADRIQEYLSGQGKLKVSTLKKAFFNPEAGEGDFNYWLK